MLCAYMLSNLSLQGGAPPMCRAPLNFGVSHPPTN